MKTLRTLAILFALCGAAFAWPACSGQWVSVPKGTTGGTLYSTGDLLFQCQPKTVPPTTPPSSNSSSNASSISASNASATASNVSSQKQTQSQTATGGTADATAANNGNNSNNSTTTINEAKIPVATAWAPPVMSLYPCTKGYSGGGQTAVVGGSFGFSKVDKNCRALVNAQNAPNKLLFCKQYIRLKDVKDSGATLAECMQSPPPVVVIPPQPPTPLPVTVTVILPPSPPSPPEYRTSLDVIAPKVKSCTITKGTVKAKVRQYKPCPVEK